MWQDFRTVFISATVEMSASRKPHAISSALSCPHADLDLPRRHLAVFALAPAHLATITCS
jgi:hypothetical protein